MKKGAIRGLGSTVPYTGRGVHLRDHVHAPGERTVLELHRDLWILLRRRVRQLPGTVKGRQGLLQLGNIGFIHPAVQAENAAAGKNTLLGLLRGQDLLDLIHAQLQRPGLRSHGPDGVQLRLPLRPDGLQLFLQPPDIVPGGARGVLELGKTEPVGPQGLQRRPLLGAVDQHLQALLLPVSGQQRHLGRLRRLRNRSRHGVEIHGAGHRTQQDGPRTVSPASFRGRPQASQGRRL